VLAELAKHPGGLSRAELIAVGLQETAFKRAIAGGLIEVRGARYVLGIVGRQQLERETAERDVKRCPCCEQTKDRSEFWKDAARADGLFAYCIECAQERRRIEMEEKQAAAQQAIREAGRSAAEAARQWDYAVGLLAASWRVLLQADTTQRTQRRTAGRDIEHGRLEARLVHPRAAYVLFRQLADANFPLPIPVHHVESNASTLVEYMGETPQEDYVDTVIIEQTEGTEVPDASAAQGAGNALVGAGDGDGAAAAGVVHLAPAVARKKRGRPRAPVAAEA